MSLAFYDELFAMQPYCMERPRKRDFYRGAVSALTRHHAATCEPYARMLRAAGVDPSAEVDAEEAFMLPIRSFKQLELRSSTDIVKTMTSSGTTGQTPSRIYLDKETSARQTKTLSRIVADFIGSTRLPMLVIDSSAVLKDRRMFSARGAGILGFSIFGRGLTYALDENMELSSELDAFCEAHAGEKVLMFGFTFMIWEHFYKALARAGRHLPLGGTLIHGGGWKKLADSAVSGDDFRAALRSVTDLDSVLNYYGMVEQTGSIFMECDHGHLHCSNFSDVIVRRPHDLSEAERGERGLLELVSLLPTSYPGHVILSEDEGEILGDDDCPCGRMGRYFKIHGRLKGAELRGCSDTYERR